MIRRSFALFATASLVTLAQAVPAFAQESRPQVEYPDEYDRYSADQLDNLVGPIALYPDALLAQVLVAATFPDQVDDAAAFVRANGTSSLDDQGWDVSVKAVAHYPSALNMMADKPDWTTALGRAYATQSSDVMAAVQRLRRMADQQGNLRTTSQQVVTRDEDDYVIAPAQPRVIYVPVYDPYVVYTRPIFGVSFASSYWSFGIGFPIGGWLSYDCDWRGRRVYYNGWDSAYYGYAGGWRVRSRPFIQFSSVYVNPRYRNVYINRDVIRRRVEYRNVDRYPGVHRDTRFDRGVTVYRGGNGRYDGRDTRYDNRNDRRDTRNDGRVDNRNDTRRESRGSDVRYTDGPRVVDYGTSRSTGTWGNDRGSSQGSADRGNAGRGQAQQGSTDGSWGRGRGNDGSDNRSGGSSNGGRYQGGQPQQQPAQDSRQGNGGGWGGRGQDRGSSGQVRDERREAPMINPRRMEPAQGGGNQGGGQGSGGQRGGGRGGDRRGGERPAI